MNRITEPGTDLAADLAGQVPADLLVVCLRAGLPPSVNCMRHRRGSEWPHLVERQVLEGLVRESEVLLLEDEGALRRRSVDDLTCTAVAADARFGVGLALELDRLAMARAVELFVHLVKVVVVFRRATEWSVSGRTHMHR